MEIITLIKKINNMHSKDHSLRLPQHRGALMFFESKPYAAESSLHLYPLSPFPRRCHLPLLGLYCAYFFIL